MELAADELDGEAPSYLFLHGLASTRSGEKSTSLLEWAHRHRRGLLRLDFRGHGESKGNIGNLTLTDLVADAQTGLEHLGRAILVGSSLGGLVAAWAAAKCPERVAGLVLIAPAFGFLARMSARPRHAGRVRIENPWVCVDIDEHMLVDAKAWPEHDLPALISVPTLIVHGVCDEVVPVAESQRVFDGIPHARKDLWLVPDGDHRLTAHIEQVWLLADRLLAARAK